MEEGLPEGAGEVAAIVGGADRDGDGLVIDDIAKRYGSVQAVDGFSLSVPRGSLIGFLGPNGAGKTTTMRAVMGMVALDRGRIRWRGREVDESTRRRIGYMPQERGLYARMKVREQVMYFARLAGLSRAEANRHTDHWLGRVGVADRADSILQDLSGGNQQRVQLAVALVNDPEILILDEPFAGLDPVAAENLRDIIDERARAGASVLFSSHQLDLVEDLCEEVAVIAAGRPVATGAISDLRAASPTRVLRVRWTDPVQDWQPLTGSVERTDGRGVEVRLPASVDLGAELNHALNAGPVAEIAVEPPTLAELFANLVTGQGREPAVDGANP